jgi:hypothetical protein
MKTYALRRAVRLLSNRSWLAMALIGVAAFWSTTVCASLAAGTLTIVSHHRSDDGTEWVIDIPVINADPEERFQVTAKVSSSDPTIRIEGKLLHVGDIPAGATVHRRLELIVRRPEHDDRRGYEDHDDKTHRTHEREAEHGDRDDHDHQPLTPPNLSTLSFVFDARIGKHVHFQAPTPAAVQHVITSILPPSPSTGMPLLFQSADSLVQVDTSKADPAVVAMGACVQWITMCMSPGRSVDDCAFSAPQCPAQPSTAGPEMCCPSACYTQYKAARLLGSEDLPALLQTYIDNGSCIPGYKGLTAIKTGH